MIYLQPHYQQAHDPQYKFNNLNLNLGGKFEKAKIILYLEMGNRRNRIPSHFHIKSEIAGVCIKFDRSEYFIDGVNKDFLTEEQATLLDKELRKLLPENSFFKDFSYWERMQWSWNSEHTSFGRSIRKIQPDYTKIHMPESLKQNLR